MKNTKMRGFFLVFHHKKARIRRTFYSAERVGDQMATENPAQ
jgi:hypothetical protein